MGESEPMPAVAFPSVGSCEHDAGKCKPCAFFHTKGCANGPSCEFCHLCPPEEVVRRRRMRRNVLAGEQRLAAREQREKQFQKFGHARQGSNTSTASGSSAGGARSGFSHSRQSSAGLSDRAFTQANCATAFQSDAFRPVLSLGELLGSCGGDSHFSADITQRQSRPVSPEPLQYMMVNVAVPAVAIPQGAGVQLNRSGFDLTSSARLPTPHLSADAGGEQPRTPVAFAGVGGMSPLTMAGY